MTKAAVKGIDYFRNTNYFETYSQRKIFKFEAMDAVTDFCQKLGVAKLEKFMVAGASKRGWTTWTTVSIKLQK